MAQGNTEINSLLSPLLLDECFQFDDSELLARFLAENGAEVESDPHDASASSLIWVVLDTFRTKLRDKRLLLLGVIHSRQRYLVLLDTKAQAIVQMVQWGDVDWPKFYWDLTFTPPNDRYILKLNKTLGFWALQPRLTMSLSMTLRRQCDKRDKTVVKYKVIQAIEESKKDAATKEANFFVQLEGIRGFNQAYIKSHKRITAVATPEKSLLELLCQRLQNIGSEEHVEQPQLEPAASAGHAIVSLLSVATCEMLVHTEGLLRDTDTEFLHQYRVNLRKIRSLLKESRSVIETESLQPHLGFFRRLSALTTPVRDYDVHLLMVDDWSRRHHEHALVDQLQPLKQLIESKRRKAWNTLVRFLRSEEYQFAMDAWRRYLSQTTQPEASLTVRELAAKRIKKCYRALLRDGRKLDKASPDEAFHDLRLDMKRLRYLLEYFAAIFPTEDYALIFKQARTLQSVLGDFHDITVQKSVLMHYADELQERGNTAPGTFVCLGFLLQEMGGNHHSLRDQFHDAFRLISAEENAKYISEMHLKANPK